MVGKSRKSLLRHLERKIFKNTINSHTHANAQMVILASPSTNPPPHVKPTKSRQERRPFDRVTTRLSWRSFHAAKNCPHRPAKRTPNYSPKTMTKTGSASAFALRTRDDPKLTHTPGIVLTCSYTQSAQ